MRSIAVLPRREAIKPNADAKSIAAAIAAGGHVLYGVVLTKMAAILLKPRRCESCDLASSALLVGG